MSCSHAKDEFNLCVYRCDASVRELLAWGIVTQTSCKIHKVIANEQAEQATQDEWERYCLNRVAPLSDD
jgi:hypothetical protein